MWQGCALALDNSWRMACSSAVLRSPLLPPSCCSCYTPQELKQPPIARSRADVRWQVLPDHLVIDSSGEQETLPWRSIARVLRTPDGFLMWRSNGFEIWLPLTAFASAEALSEFSQMAQTHAQKYVQIS